MGRIRKGPSQKRKAHSSKIAQNTQARLREERARPAPPYTVQEFETPKTERIRKLQARVEKVENLNDDLRAEIRGLKETNARLERDAEASKRRETRKKEHIKQLKAERVAEETVT